MRTRLTERDLSRIVRRVIKENEKPEWADSLERRLNRSIDINRDKRFTNSPQASVRFIDSPPYGQYVDIEIMYDHFMSESDDSVGYILKDKVQNTMEDIGEENGIEFKFMYHNLVDYVRRHSSRDFSNGSYRLNFRYEVIE